MNLLQNNYIKIIGSFSALLENIESLSIIFVQQLTAQLHDYLQNTIPQVNLAELHNIETQHSVILQQAVAKLEFNKKNNLNIVTSR